MQRNANPTLRPVRAWLARCGAAALLALVTACGGGGGGGTPSSTTTDTTPPIPAGTNVAELVVDRGFDNSSINSPYVSVQVCAPGTATCQTIDHVLVDTGSYGLRLLAGALTVALPTVAAPGGAPLAECASFVSGYAWGSVRTADVQVAGEKAAGVPVQVVNDPAPAYATVPVACNNTGAPMGVGSGAKGILGVGFLAHDCGTTCVNTAAANMYYQCATDGTGCTSTTVPLASQVTNPATLFATDNNGVVIRLPDIGASGASVVRGELAFGIGTQPNNALGSAQVFTADASGTITTVYNGTTLRGFLDSGSNGLFFHDATIPLCGGGSGFYCPVRTLALTATVTGTNGATRSVPFEVQNPNALPAGTAAAKLGGDLGLTRSFDWGLPFYFGRTVFSAFSGASTPKGPGPYYAF
jgi:hypothetical protein